MASAILSLKGSMGKKKVNGRKPAGIWLQSEGEGISKRNPK